MGWDGSLRGVVWRKSICIGLIKGLGNRVWPKTPKILVFKEILDFLGLLAKHFAIILWYRVNYGPLKGVFNWPYCVF